MRAAIEKFSDVPKQHVLVFPKYAIFKIHYFQNIIKVRDFAELLQKTHSCGLILPRTSAPASERALLIGPQSSSRMGAVYGFYVGKTRPEP